MDKSELEANREENPYEYWQEQQVEPERVISDPKIVAFSTAMPST